MEQTHPEGSVCVDSMTAGSVKLVLVFHFTLPPQVLPTLAPRVVRV